MGKGINEVLRLYFIVAFGVFVLDIATKELAEKFFTFPYDPLPFLKLYLIHNKGVAFGLFSDLPDFLRIPILVIIPLVALFITLFYTLFEGNKFTALCMGLIAGGALGNLYDRVFLGQVRDFIHLHIGDYYWPAFNVADASITIGIALLILKNLLGKHSLKGLVNRAR
ncbi:signal peptidase II [Aquifex pyrophilus]